MIISLFYIFIVLLSCWLIISYGKLFERYNKVIQEYNVLHDLLNEISKKEEAQAKKVSSEMHKVDVFCGFEEEVLANLKVNSKIILQLNIYNHSLKHFYKRFDKSLCRYLTVINKKFMPLMYKEGIEGLKYERRFNSLSLID